MRETVRNFSIGIVSAVALGGLATLLLLFGEFTGFIESRSPLEVSLNAAGGLRKGSLVTLHGVPVGLIDRIELDRTSADRPVLVHVLVDAATPIPRSASPVVEASLLGSGAKLELQPSPAGLAGTPGFHDLTQTVRLTGDYQPIDAKFIAALDERLTSLRGSLDDSLSDFRTFAQTYTALGRNLNDLVQPIDAGSDEAAREASLRTSVVRLNETLTETRDAMRLARAWLSDEAIERDVRAALANANELFLRATDAVNTINGFAMNLDADRNALIARVLPVIDETRGAMSDVRRLLQTATSGEGTIGRLLQDPALYKDLSDSARHLSAALEAIQAVAEKLKAEGIVIEF
jgi:ABC-type transporter Mla subunit MlaD